MKIMTMDSDVCEFCNKKIKENKVTILGKEMSFKIMCECIRTKLKNKDELEKKRCKLGKLSRLYKQSRLGKRFENSNFNRIKITEHNNKCVNSLKYFAENFKSMKNESFILFSHPGTGKTLFVSAVVNYLISNMTTAIFVTVPDLLSQIRASYNKEYGYTENNILSGLLECDLLVLDDMGSEKGSDWASEKLFQIINSRYNNMKSIIFTTNCNNELLRNKVGNRIFSRIMEMCKIENRFNLEKERDWRI